MTDVQLFRLSAPEIEIRFTDTAGRRWRRFKSALTQIF